MIMKININYEGAGLMVKNILIEYINRINYMDDKDYLFSRIAYYIAPTLIDHKPSTIITLAGDGRNCCKLWEIYRDDFKREYGIEYYELKQCEKSVTIIFYYQEILSSVIYEKENISFLKHFGYREDVSLKENMVLLKKRFQNVCPHEVGIFLGIPLEDVITFIECPNKECLLCGYWKAYNNVESARQKFYRYDRARNNVIQAVLKGIKLSAFTKEIRYCSNVVL
jgi:hypothetical protein